MILARQIGNTNSIALVLFKGEYKLYVKKKIQIIYIFSIFIIQMN